MKKRLLKTLIFTALLMSILFAFNLSASAKTVVSGDFKFDVGSSSATLLEYTGTDKKVEIPSKAGSVKVTAIGNEAFWQNKTMTEVIIPGNVKSIGDAAFNECTSLKKVVIPSKVTKIGEGAFWYCSALESVVIPESVSKIGNNAFKGCNALTAYTVKGSYGESYIKGLDYVKLAYRYATSLKLSSSSLTMAVGGTKTLTPTLSPTPLYNDAVSFKSADTKVATVDTSGNITAVGAGTVKITVTAKDGSKKSATCTVTVNPAKVKNFRTGTLIVSSAQLNWDKVAGATGYKVYKYNASTKKWASLGTTTKLTFTDKTAKIGETLKYRVRAYTKTTAKTYYGSYTSTLTVKMPAPGTVTKLTAAASTSYVKLSWGKADTATGYRVYQYSPSKKKFVRKVSTTSLKATVKGLKAGTEYTFAVQAYYKDSKGNVTFAEKQETVVITTRPSKVTGLTLIKGSESFDRISVSWTPLTGVTGYELQCVPEKGEAVTRTVPGAESSRCVIDSLTYGTAYTVKIRAYIQKESGTAYSYYGSEVKAQTIAMPATADEAFSSFTAALNATKNYSGNAALYISTDLGNFSGENADKYQSVTDNAFKAKSDIAVFEKGLDKNGLAPTAYITPLSSDCTLTAQQLNAGSLTYKGNGSGYEISFTVPGENAALIAPVIDTAAIEKSTDGFSLGSCTYKNTKITAKVQSGYISHMEISQDVEVSFKIGLRSYSYTQTVNTVYAFIEL
ncbi:MAG: leucine-rich repeat protein [Clostridia bacterium]|nr:leucine-rich repeat protein [Clostridia bacterium]